MVKIIDFILVLLTLTSLAFLLMMLVPRHAGAIESTITANVVDAKSTGMTTVQMAEGSLGDARWRPYSPMWNLMSCCKQFWLPTGMISGYCYTDEIKRWMDNDSCNTFGY